jgi:iron complex outermembrane receptor protein
MFKSICVAAILLLSARAYAQEFSISGSVRDAKSNQPLSGATVLVEESDQGTVTDEAGRFQLSKLPAGRYVLQVKFIGYGEKEEAVNVSQDLDLAIALNETFQLTEEVVVVATRADDKTPTTFTNVDKQAIQKQNFGQDLPFLLNWTPSVVTTSDAGTGIGYTGLRIRGSDATRINVTINGIPYNDSESQGTYWVNIPDIASSTQSVQIQRGVGTSTNGAGAFGGSVNLQTLSLNPEPYADVMAAGGSFNSQRYTLRAGTGLINQHWAFDAKVSKITSDGYVDRASADLGSHYLSAGYYGKNTVIKALTFGGHEKTYQAWYGVDGETLKTNRTMNYAGAIYDADGNITRYYDNQVDDYRQDHYQLHVSQTLNDHWQANVSLHYTYGRGFYEEYHQGVGFSAMNLSNIVIGDDTLKSSDFIVRKWLDNKFYGATFSVNYTKNKTNLTIGGAVNRYGDAKHYGEIIWAQYAGDVPVRHHFYDGVSEKDDANIYAKWNYALTGSLNAFVDMQYRRVGYQTEGVTSGQRSYHFDERFNFFNPKAGLSYSLSEEDILYGSYAVANREPSRTDFVDGDVVPKSERLGNFETGWRRNTGRYRLEAVYYLMNYKDQLVLTGEVDDVGTPIRANVGKSFRTGVELASGIQVSKRWKWNANVTWSVNKNKDFVYQDESDEDVKRNTDIILSPRWIGGSQLTWIAFTGFEVSALSKFVGKQYLDNTQNEARTLSSYWVQDLRLNYTVQPKGMKGLSFALLLNNILDEEYSSNGVMYGDVPLYYPQAGRNFLAMVTLSF